MDEFTPTERAVLRLILAWKAILGVTFLIISLAVAGHHLGLWTLPTIGTP